MARRKLAVVPTGPKLAELPEHVKEAPVMHRKKVTKRSLQRYSEQMALLHSTALIPEMFKQLYQKACLGDAYAISKIAEIYQYTQRGNGGVSITNNIVQNNANLSSGGNAGFDAVVRELAKSRSDQRQSFALEEEATGETIDG